MKNTVEAGCDEAGRGCLAGPVFAAAVILPDDYSNPILNDSKKLSHKQRSALRCQIEKDALSWAVASVDNTEIDRTNILKASIHAMNLAVSKLSVTPAFLIVDGNRFVSENGIPFRCIVKGDATYQSIAAASILAKTYRDDYMDAMNIQYPEYDWASNKGYPTARHYEAILAHGITPLHRRSFNLYRQQELSFDDDNGQSDTTISHPSPSQTSNHSNHV